MTQIINHCRVLSGWSPYGEAEILNILPTWMDALKEIPDNLLKNAMDRATADHDWSQPFPVKAMVAAYKAIILEDRQARERASYANSRRADDTYACRYCDDTGYIPVQLYCGSFNDWRSARRACACDATPITQRLPIPDMDGWSRDDRGDWVPESAAGSLRCHCLYCKNGRGK